MPTPRSQAAHPLTKVNYTDLQGRIARARGMDPAKLSDEEVFNRIARISDGYTTICQLLQTNMVFRARLNDGETPYATARELWYPPAEFVRRGRFNAAGETRLYVANRFHAALYEMRPQIGDVFTILVARRREPYRDIVLAHIGMERCLANEVAVGARAYLLRNNPLLQRMLNSHGVATKWFAIDDYLADIATEKVAAAQEHDAYKKTNALARILSRIPDTDGIQYPSVSTRLNAVNLCLYPEKADELFKPSEAWMLRVEGHVDELPNAEPNPAGFLGIRFLSRSEHIGPDGELHWRPVGDERHAEYIFGAPGYPT